MASPPTLGQNEGRPCGLPSRAACEGATQLVNTDRNDASAEGAEWARGEHSREPNKTSATTKYSFTGRNLTAYGELLPVAAMLEKLEFRELLGTSVNLEPELCTGPPPGGLGCLGSFVAVAWSSPPILG